ncbi:UNVERIFIED_CONTAM: ALBINO3-like protein 3, mitochondrial [Sesamum indicum]
MRLFTSKILRRSRLSPPLSQFSSSHSLFGSSIQHHHNHNRPLSCFRRCSSVLLSPPHHYCFSFSRRFSSQPNLSESDDPFLPVQALISLLDAYHDATDFPWWIIISSSTVAMRLALFPLVVLQLKKLKRIGEVLPKCEDGLLLSHGLIGGEAECSCYWLNRKEMVFRNVTYDLFLSCSSLIVPPPFPPPLSGRSFRDQIALFWKEKKAAGCPSVFWFISSFTFQVPCFFLWIMSIRRMSLDHHPGFDSGGFLWLQDLTGYPHGVLGPIFPLIIAGLHFTNVQSVFFTNLWLIISLISIIVSVYNEKATLDTRSIFSKIIIATRTGFLRIINKDIQDLSATADTAYFDCYIQCSPGMLSILAYKWFFESDTDISIAESFYLDRKLLWDDEPEWKLILNDVPFGAVFIIMSGSCSHSVLYIEVTVHSGRDISHNSLDWLKWKRAVGKLGLWRLSGYSHMLENGLDDKSPRQAGRRK